jgi:Flp pilus assembly protein protease CpaA
MFLAPLRMAWWQGVAGVAVALLLAFPGWRFGGAMRAGDVKLLLAAGGLLGLQGSIRAVAFVYVLALPFGIAVLAVRGRLSRLWAFWVRGERDEPTKVAFAPVIALAVLLARLQPWPELW